MKNGEEAILVKKISENEFLVNPMAMFYNDQTGEEYQGKSDVLKIVSEIFKKAPVPKINKEFADISEKVNKKTEELNILNKTLKEVTNEIHKIKYQLTDLKKFIINRKELKEAKRITVFEKGYIKPHTLSEKDKNHLKIQITIEVCDGEERAYFYNWYGDNWSNSSTVDMNYGFIVDKTDEEIIEITKKRAVDIDVKDWELRNADNKYLTEDLILRKNKLLEDEEKKEIEKLKKEINIKKERLIELTKQKEEERK
jgi:septal ring factor EnvC (AmiA/AmiB activator)